jgi:hypothetical protein
MDVFCRKVLAGVEGVGEADGKARVLHSRGLYDL